MSVPSLSRLTRELGYQESPHFVTVDQLDRAFPSPRHLRKVLRHARISGIYLLRPERGHPTPMVAVAEAPTEAAALAVHSAAWNRGLAPFILVRTPDRVLLFRGFDPGTLRPPTLLEISGSLSEVANRLDALSAVGIDSGACLRAWPSAALTGERSDVRLLANLATLAKKLDREGLEPGVSHALIGRFIFLRYLRDRDILSDRRLADWNLTESALKGRNLQVDTFVKLCGRLEGWLNGGVFPISHSAYRQEHLTEVARAFFGDDAESGQLALFSMYDFKYVPTETLSAVYEQFLNKENRAGEAGAVYTPPALVEHLVDRCEYSRQLAPGQRILDPACGSGAFLVHAYRRLVEEECATTGRVPAPERLRDLLTESIFGVDTDPDACRVTHLSLLLTLLDYCEPADLMALPGFKLPGLFGDPKHAQKRAHPRDVPPIRVVTGDFFDDSSLESAGLNTRFDLIVGNPPWTEIGAGSWADKWRKMAVKRGWVVTNAAIEEAFAWRVLEYLAEDGNVCLLVAASTLFKDATEFRAAFLRSVRLDYVANLTNLREALFGGRGRLPAVALTYSHGDPGESITVWSPLVATQVAPRSAESGRAHLWALVPSATEMGRVPLTDVLSGSPTPWRVAMWGSGRDLDLIRKLGHTRLADLSSVGIHANAGPELGAEVEDATVLVTEAVGKPKIRVQPLSRLGRVYALPPSCFEDVPKERAHRRKRDGNVDIPVCRPPHVFVDAWRRHAVFLGDYAVIPPRQIGVWGPEDATQRLIALSLYLSSDLAWYLEFFRAPQVEDRRVRTLESLRWLPVPRCILEGADLGEWERLHARLVAASPSRWKVEEGRSLFRLIGEEELEKLEDELNDLVYREMGVHEEERWLVEDLVHVKMGLLDGKLEDRAVEPPTDPELLAYCTVLQSSLDAFWAEERLGHLTEITHDDNVAVARVEFTETPVQARRPVVKPCATGELRQFDDLLSRQGQWAYFDRRIFVFDDSGVFVAAPMERFWWTRSAALTDSDEIIASLITGDVQ